MYMRHTQRFAATWYHGANGTASNPDHRVRFRGFSGQQRGLPRRTGGVGLQSWENERGDKLSMNTFIARGQGSVNFRTPTNMPELAVFSIYSSPRVPSFELGEHKEVDAAFVIYPQLGLEFTAYFGDFKPPRKGNKKRRNRRKKRGGRR